METKMEPGWLEERSAQTKFEFVNIPTSDFVAEYKVVPFPSHFVQETKCNTIYSNNQKKSSRIEMKEGLAKLESTSDGRKYQREETAADEDSEIKMQNNALWFDERGKEPFPKQCPRYISIEDEDIDAEEQIAQQMRAKAGYTRLLALNRRKRYRQKIKEDPVKYAAYLAKERDRYKNKRKLRKEGNKLNPTQLEMKRLKATIRQRAYRRRKAGKTT